MSDPAPPAPDQYTNAISQFRGASKWLLSAFAAVGAVLISGVQITGLGSLSGHRLTMAVVGLAIGLLGVAIAIAAAVRVLTPQAVVPEELPNKWKYRPLQNYVKRYPSTLLRNKASGLSDLVQKSGEAQEKEREAYLAAKQLAPSDAGYEAAVAAYETATTLRKDLSVRVSSLQGLGLLLVVRRRFLTGVVVMLIGASLAAAGAVMLAYWANPPRSSQPEATTDLLRRGKVRLVLTPAGSVLLRPHIGRRCDLNTLKALVVGGTSETPRLLVIPARHCAALELPVPQTIGLTSN